MVVLSLHGADAAVLIEERFRNRTHMTIHEVGRTAKKSHCNSSLYELASCSGLNQNLCSLS